MHVLHLPSWYPTAESPYTGVYFREQAALLQSDGLTVGVVYPEHHSLRHLSLSALRRNWYQTEWTDEVVPTLRRHSWNAWSRLRWGLRQRTRSAVAMVRAYVNRRGRPDLIHAQSAQWAAAAAARASHALDIPYVVVEHFSGYQEETLFSWQWDLVEEGLRNADAIACVSRSLRRDLVTRGLVSDTDVGILPNPVDPDFFCPPPASETSPGSNGAPLHLVTVTRLVPPKGVDVLLRALALLPRTVTLTVVGEGPEATALQRLTRRLGIEDRVRFPGALDRSGVRAAYWAGDVFVLPSRVETFGVVLLEAMATGLPVIATRCGGPQELVNPSTGRLVPVDDAHALATAIWSLVQSDAPFDPVQIRRRTIDRYGPKPFLQRTRALYAQALGDSTTPYAT